MMDLFQSGRRIGDIARVSEEEQTNSIEILSRIRYLDSNVLLENYFCNI
jgi:hypothetical protein